MLHPYRYSQRAKHLRHKTWVFPRDYRANASPLQVLVPQELGDPTKETGFFREYACRNEVSWQKPGFWAPMVNPVTINLLPPPLFHWLWALVAAKVAIKKSPEKMILTCYNNLLYKDLPS